MNDEHAVVLLLPGQGMQRTGMASELYRADAGFAAELDHFFHALSDGQRLRDRWIAGGQPIDVGRYAQPLLFGLGYALGRTLRDRHHVTPHALLGHSIGELAAAALAGVFDQTSIGPVLDARVAALAEAPAGGMLATTASVAELDGFLTQRVVVAASNAEHRTVLSGPAADLAEVAGRLAAADLTVVPVAAHEPYHSPELDAVATVFTQALRSVALGPPLVPIWSTRTGALLRDAQARSPEFWADQLTRPVRFAQALHALLSESRYEHVTLLDASPDQSLAALCRQHPRVRTGTARVLPLLSPRPGRTLGFWQAAIAELGCSVAPRADLEAERI